MYACQWSQFCFCKQHSKRQLVHTQKNFSNPCYQVGFCTELLYLRGNPCYPVRLCTDRISTRAIQIIQIKKVILLLKLPKTAVQLPIQIKMSPLSIACSYPSTLPVPAILTILLVKLPNAEVK